ncbi:MAG TPA: hypothetical protein VM287_08710 [Egibacteraceae bacterium]|nr:hypothetical protein [Egibacteraceae bacterium]
MNKPTEGAVNPKLLYALGALVVVALLFLFVVKPIFLGGDGLDDPVALPVPAVPHATTPDEETDEEDGDVVEDSLEVFNVRDPFHQLVPAAPAGE